MQAVRTAQPQFPSFRPSITVSNRVQRYLWLRSCIERPLAAVLLLVFFPLIYLMVIFAGLLSPGSGIYSQTRVGRNGRLFKIYKIRTMSRHAERGTGAVWASAKDSRVTTFGRFLRWSHLDEFPQLFNVLYGHMSLIGPRPERPEIVAKLIADIPEYLDRLAVLPGITGLAQAHLPPDTNFDSVRLKVAFDLKYIETASLWTDLLICFHTALRFLPFAAKGKAVRLGPGVASMVAPDESSH